MPRESGASSNPKLHGWNTGGAAYWIVRWSLSSGAHSRDPLADDDDRGRR
jgi:hypothetical protein